jgi:transcriptional/translational regulatory protein YebC/TACO1
MSQDRGKLQSEAMEKWHARIAEIEKQYQADCLATDLAHNALLDQLRDALQKARERPLPDHKVEQANRDARLEEANNQYHREMFSIYEEFGVGDGPR